MLKSIPIDYDLNEWVSLKALNSIIGKIISIQKCAHGIRYDVRYFDGCDYKHCYFYSDELKPSEAPNYD